MNVKEFVNKFNSKDFNIESIDNAKKYLSVTEKRQLAVGVISMCTDDIDGFIEVNKFKMKIYFEMLLLKEYFRVDVSTDFNELIKEYDFVCESGILYLVHSLLSYDYNELKEILDQELNDLLEENSIQKQIVKVVGKLNDIMDVFRDKIKDIDISELLSEGTDIESFSKIFDMFK